MATAARAQGEVAAAAAVVPSRPKAIEPMSQPFLRSGASTLFPVLSLVFGVLLGLGLHHGPGTAAATGHAPVPEETAPPLTRLNVRPRDTAPDTSRAQERIALSGTQQRAESGAVAPQQRTVPSEAPAPPSVPSTPNARAFAGLEHLQLALPEGVRAIGFHESGDRRALPMHPMGIPKMNGNVPRLPSAPVGDGFEYLVLPSRGRSNGPTTAVDLSIPHNTAFTSPVTGTISHVQTYALYGRYPDNMVFIVPDSRPDLVVVIMHLNGVRVAVGDRVEAGSSLIALTARQLPFASQIDAFAGHRPHAHIEVRRT
jgi:hypothetical protein